MRSNIALDNDLIAEAFRYSKAKTRKELIHQALKEFINIQKRKNLLALSGKIKFDENYDYKILREA